MKTISAAMILQDEEMNIPFSIHNPLLIYDEVFVVDGGSKDRTLKVIEQKAKELGMEHKLNIHYNKFVDLNTQRNYYLKRIKSDYLHYIDGDEIYAKEDLEKIKYNYINEYNCILIKSFHFYLDFWHIACSQGFLDSWKMPKCFKNIVGHMEYEKYAPLRGDHNLRIDNIPYTKYWENSTKLCELDDIACYHLSHGLGEQREHRRIMFQIRYENPQLKLSDEELNTRAWQSCYFDKRAWDEHINPDVKGIKRFNGKHPEIIKSHPLYNIKIIKD